MEFIVTIQVQARDGRMVSESDDYQVRARSVAGAVEKAIRAAGRERRTTRLVVRTPSGREVRGTWGPDVTSDVLGRARGLALVYFQRVCGFCDRDTCEGCSEPDERPSSALEAVARSAIALANGRLADAERNANEAFRSGGESDYWRGFRDQMLSLAAEVPFEFKEDQP